MLSVLLGLQWKITRVFANMQLINYSGVYLWLFKMSHNQKMTVSWNLKQDFCLSVPSLVVIYVQAKTMTADIFLTVI